MSESTEKTKKLSEKESRLSERMRTEARNLGLCDEWYNAWGDASIEDMLGKLKKGFDFVLQHHWPSPSFMKEQAGVGVLRSNLILCDDKWSLNCPPECFIMGESQSNLRYNGRAFGIAWICGSSRVELSARNNSSVVVELCDSAQLIVNHVDPDAKVTVVTHGHQCFVDYDDNMNVYLKEGERYDV